MGQKAVQGLAAQLSAVSPAFLVRIGSRGFNAVAKFGRVSKPKFQNFARNASVELAPPAPSEFIAQVSNLKNDVLAGKRIANISNMSVNEVAANGLVVAEVAFWFYIGEMIGRGSIIGYNPKVE